MSWHVFINLVTLKDSCENTSEAIFQLDIRKCLSNAGHTVHFFQLFQGVYLTLNSFEIALCAAD